MKTINVNEEKNPAIPSAETGNVTLEASQSATCSDCYEISVIRSSRSPKLVDLCSLHAAAPALVAALKSVVAAHCPNDKVFCGSCSPARDVLSLVGGGQ